MSTELRNAVQSAIDGCCESFAAGIETTQEEAIVRAMKNALVDPTQFDELLEAELRAMPNLSLFDKAAILKMVGDLWDNYVQPWDFPIPDLIENQVKAFTRSVLLYVAGIVVDRIFGT